MEQDLHVLAGSGSNEPHAHAGSRAGRAIYVALLAVNVGYALALWMLLLLLRAADHYYSPDASVPARLFGAYIHHRMMLTPRHPFAVSGPIDLILIFLTASFSVILLLFYRLMSNRRWMLWILKYIGGAAALVAVPIAWASRGGVNSVPGPPWMLALSVVVLAGILFLTRRHPSPAWSITLIAHYGLWAWLLARDPVYGPMANYLPLSVSAASVAGALPVLLSAISPVAGFVWAHQMIRERGLKRPSHD